MHHTLLKRSIIYTIVHFSLCATIATGCDWCKGSVDKSTIINIGKTPPEIPEPKEPQKKAEPDDPSPKGSLDPSGKEDKEEGDSDEGEDEDLKKKIEEELTAEQQRLEKEKKLLEEEKALIQYNADDDCYPPTPSAPNLDDLPPSYDQACGNNASTSSPYNHPTSIASNACEACLRNDNRVFDPDDIENIRENLGTKLTIINYKLAVLDIFQQGFKRWFKKQYLPNLKNSKVEHEQELNNLQEAQGQICNNLALCTSHKIAALKDNLTSINAISYKINCVDHMINKIKQKQKNKSEASSYPKQEYAPQFTTERLDTPWPPNYDQHGLINDKKLYPHLPGSP